MNTGGKDICKKCGLLCDWIQRLKEDAHCYLNSITKITYRKKETILKQGSHASHIFFLQSGLVKILTERRNEKNILLRIITPGQFIGISNLHTDISNFTAVALKESELCLIPRDSFVGIMGNDNVFAKQVVDLQAENASFLMERISSIGTKQMHGRLADAIIYLCNNVNGHNVFDYLSRKDIAELSAMSPESAIRLLTEFKNDGLIRIEGKQFVINNLELLARLSEIG
jgi:CRP/FNR family transcriptional regulator, polysaccharide utilization system transcription regulator